LRAKHVGFIGLREVDPCETRFLDQLKIAHYSMKEVDELGIKEVNDGCLKSAFFITRACLLKVVKRCLDQINPGKKLPLHVSFDIDALDPNEAPATGTRGG